MLETFAALWVEDISMILSYLPPESLIAMGYVNQKILKYVQNYFSQLRKNSLEKISLEDPDKWHLAKDVIQDYLIIIKNDWESNRVMHPVSMKGGGNNYKIYGWIICDSQRKYSNFGRWADWVWLSKWQKNCIMKIVPAFAKIE